MHYLTGAEMFSVIIVINNIVKNERKMYVSLYVHRGGVVIIILIELKVEFSGSKN